MDTFIQLFLRGLETGSVYALATLGIIIIARTSGVTNFALGTIATLNTYVVAWLSGKMGVPLLPSILIGVICAILISFLIDLLLIRHTMKITPMSKQIIALGLIMIFSGVAPSVFGVDPYPMQYLLSTESIRIGEAALTYNSMFNIGLVLAVLIGLFYLLQKTKLGIAIRTTASIEPVARLMGVPTKLVTLFAWTLACVLGTLAGVMVSPSTTVHINLMAGVQMNALFACVLGGFQTFYGAVVAAFILGVGKNLLVYFVSDSWGEQILFVLVLVVLAVRPVGLFGKKYIKKV